MQTQWSVIIEILKKIADLKFQKEVWTKRRYKHPLFDFGETINTLEDYYFFDSVKEREMPFGEKDYEALDQYIERLTSYTAPGVLARMLNDPGWINITQETKRIINILETHTPAGSSDLKNYYS